LEPWQDLSAVPFVRIEQVTRVYGDVYAVDDVSLDIYRGEFFSLLGSSGCGKSTLLRMLAGFERPTTGRLWIDGVDVTAMPPYKRPVNMMFQSYALFPHMSVERNVAFGLRQEGLPRAEIHERVAQVLELVRLQGLARRKPEQLSGGQRQRVALARCLVKQPKLLLLDEPLGALDKKLREHTQFELVNLQERLGITFIMVTHDQEEAMTMSSRMAVMDAGRIIQVGTPAHIYEYPATRFVADFVGAANLFDGRVESSEDGIVRVRVADVATLFTTHYDKPLATGTEVTVALRPEKVRVLIEDDGAEANRLRGVVAEIGYLGDISIYHIRLESGRTVQAQLTNRERAAGAQWTWDQQVCLGWSEGSAVLLER
jgi:putrescine transport system ATP-binding protein